MTKLPAFLKREGLSNPELTVACRESSLGSHLRSIPYLELFDFFTIANPSFVPNDPNLQAIWDEAYLKNGRSIIPDVMGFDYFMSYNGRINAGGWIEEDDLPCDWYPPMRTADDLSIQHWANYYRLDFGRYAVMFWPFYGTYEAHLRDFPLEPIADALNRFLKETKLIPVFVGAEWDIGLNPLVRDLMVKIPGAVDRIGSTTLVQSFGLLKGARIVLGYHAGLTQMAAVFGTRTCLLWDDAWPESTSWACVPPAARHANYEAVRTKNLTVDQYVGQMMNLYERL